MSISSRLVPRLRPVWPSAIHVRSSAHTPRTLAEEWPQRTPLGPYYETILRNPTQYRRLEKVSSSAAPEAPSSEKQSVPTESEPTTTASPTIQSQSTSETQSSEERLRNIFGSRVLTPEEIASRLAVKTSKSTTIAGIVVPPKPEEPDNCCMSGCVNCVWERFREEMEEWTLQNTLAQKAVAEQSGSMDSDGGGSESNWTPGVVGVGDTKIAKNLWEKDVFEGVPVGIREFMKQEKRLKEQHERERSVGSS